MRPSNNARFRHAIKQVRAAGHSVSICAYLADKRTASKSNGIVSSEAVEIAENLAQELWHVADDLKTLYPTKTRSSQYE
jgi:hypothetical protein